MKNFGKIIDDFSSENTVTARIGGDEFAILLKDKSYNFLEDIYSKHKSIENYNSNNRPIYKGLNGFHIHKHQ